MKEIFAGFGFLADARTSRFPPLARWRRRAKINYIIANNLQVRKFCTLKF
jgi:hypothetical protein